MATDLISAEEALSILKKNNEKYVSLNSNPADISLQLRQNLVDNGQHPFAVVVSCSDSRVVPEDMFLCGLGDIFTVRVAGNVIGDTQLASIVYAAHHLGSKLVVVLGHTHCGAVGAALENANEDALAPLLDNIKNAIKGESDEFMACKLNVLDGIKRIDSAAEIKELKEHGLQVVGAIYNTDSGRVDFF